MLRLWLSLAVEADEPVALPNLDFKIETGDSLVAPSPQDMPDLFRARLQHSADVLTMVKHQFLVSHGSEKEGFKKTIVSEEARLRSDLAAEYGNGVADWRIQFAEAFARRRNGFDIVLANPPYVRHELIKELKPRLKELYGQDYAGTADLYCYFYLRSLQLLRPGGMLAFISSNKWLRASYGAKLREALSRRARLLRIIDFGDAPVFKAIAYPCIVVLQSVDPNPSLPPLLALTWKSTEPIASFVEVVARDSFPLPQAELRDDGWRILPSSGPSLIESIRAEGRPLREYVGARVRRGITTGLNDAFIVDRDTCARLIREHRSSRSIFKPFIRGRDIERWITDEPEQFLMKIPSTENCAHPWSGNSKKAAENIFQHSYPAIHRFHQQFRRGLIERYDQGRFFWELRACTYWDEFEAPKIVSTKVSIRPTFAIDDSGSYLANTAYFFPAAAGGLYVLGLLNSNVFFAYAKQVFVEKQNGWYEVQPAALEAFPIATAKPDEQAAVERIVEYIVWLARWAAKSEQSAGSTERVALTGFERLLNALVYELYFRRELNNVDEQRAFDVVIDGAFDRLAEIAEPKRLSYLTDLARSLAAADHPIRQTLERHSRSTSVQAVEGCIAPQI